MLRFSSLPPGKKPKTVMHLKCHPSLTDQSNELLCKHKTHLPHTQLFELHWSTQKTDNNGGKELSNYYNMALSFFFQFHGEQLLSFSFFFLVRARQLKPQLNFLRRGRCDRQMAKVQKAFTRILPAGQEWSPSFVGKDASMWSAYTTMMPVHCSSTTLLCPYFFFYRVPRMSFNIFI